MANFFTRALDKITPWNRGGEVQRNIQAKKKKKQDEQYQTPTVRKVQPVQQPNAPKPQRPDNLFKDLNSSLKLPSPPDTTTQVPETQTYKKPGLLQTVADTATGSLTNLPEVGLAVARVGTGLVQGAAHIPSLFTHAANYVPRKIAGDDSAINRTLSKVNEGVDKATAVVDKPINYVNRGLDTAAKKYEQNQPMAAGGAKVYRTTQVPLNVLAALLTLGGSSAAEAGNAGKLAQIGRFFNAPRVSNTNNIISKTAQTVNKGAPVARGVMSPVKTARQGIQSGVNRFRSVPTASGDIRAGEIGNVLTESQLQELTGPTQIPVGTGVNVNAPPSNPVSVPVRNMNQPGRLIQEVTGDATTATPNPLIRRTAEDIRARNVREAAFDQAKTAGRPNPGIEGVTPRTGEPFKLTDEAVKKSQDELIDSYASMLRDLGEGNGVDVNKVTNTRVSNNYRPGMGNKRMTKAAWREEAEKQLRSGKAESSIQKAFNDAADPEVQSLLAKGEQTKAPVGRPIVVKDVKSIPVTDQTVVPQNLPETPGTVRATTATAPNNAKSAAVAAQTPVALPKEVQAVLDNPKQFTKRQVQSARNQRKLAKQLAKTKAEIQAVIDNSPELAPKPEGNPGFVPTGEFRRGENGNVYEVAHGSTESAQAAADTANLSSGDVLSKAAQDIAQNGLISPESVRNMQALLESGRYLATSPEYKALAKTLYGAGSDYGRGLSLFNPTLRRTASGDQLANRFISKLYGVAEDPNKFTDAHFNMVQQAENQFTTARDAANQALDRYNATKSVEDFNAWKQAQQVADEAEKHSLITEYRVANDVLKGNKNPEAAKAIQKAEQEAGVYQMDWIDASMLSSTGTFARNYINTSLVRLENRLFGGRGYSSKGAKLGNKLGNRTVVSDFKARNELDQNKLSKVVKQWSTTGNTLGEGNIKAVATARAYKYYENQLKSQGVTGDQLKRDTEVMLHSDPDGMAQHYETWALSENALSSMAHNSKKIEQTITDAIARKGGKLAEVPAKAIVRLTIGFPTVIGRSLYGGAKRATLGVPELIGAGAKLAKGDKQAAADLLYNAKIHAGSGASLYALGTVLASAGLISPSYPSDPEEAARWKAEGIQPNSIKIAGQWFNIPGYFGALALPLVIPANVINKTSPKDILKGVVDGVADLSPTAGLQNFIDGIEGRGGKQWVKNEVASLTRAMTPVGSLLNEIAKMTDDTKNDTTTKDTFHNILDAIAGGIPGVNNMVNKIDATDDNGNVLHNPNPAATFFGAQGSVQPQGVQDNAQAQAQADDSLRQLADYGVLNDKNLMGLVDKKLQAQINSGQPLKPEQIDEVKKAVAKGVSQTGEDTAYLENGQYDTHLAALRVKRDLLAADPTTKPSDLKELDMNIKRGQVYKDNQIPYDLIDAYKSTSVSDWRKMGIPPGDKNYDPDYYDPEMYQRLWEVDSKLASSGVSYRKNSPDKNKYYAKDTSKNGSSRTKQLDTSFGTLKGGDFAPQVKQYDSIDIKSGNIPHISVVRPNIVHKISSG